MVGWLCVYMHNNMARVDGDDDIITTTTTMPQRPVDNILSKDIPKHLRIEHKHGINWIGRRRGRRRHAHSEIGPKDYVVERGQRLNHRFYVKNGKYLFASLPCVCVFHPPSKGCAGEGGGDGRGAEETLCV